jgi:amino acid adenylation domain-containing protein
VPLRPATRDDVLPLSFAQQRLWFLDQLVPENIAYNMAEGLRLHGALNVAALEQSINEVRRRHEAVRTTFPEVDGNPIQVIAPFRPLDLPLVDLSSLSAENHEAHVARLAAAEAQRPFDLQSGPLLRATLLLLGPEEHVLLFSMHHIISDGWSNGILVKEVTALYDAFTNGNASPFRDLAIQYADFAVWQRQWLSGNVLARQLDYWTSKLQDVPPLLTLPTDYPRPKVQLTEGAFSTHLLNAELTASLKSLAQQSGATLYMTMMAAFHALLHRYAHQATIVTGTPTANRTRVETEPLIGFFVNTLVLRSDFDDDPTFLTHLSRLRKHALEAYAYQDFPFEMLVDELQLTRDLSYNPLFQVMFNWEEATLDEMTLTGLELGRVGVQNQTSQFDLTLHMREVDGRLQCAMQYNTALFEASTIKRMLGHYEQLLASVVRQPRQRISELPLLTGAEQNRLLVEWNDTAAVYEYRTSVAQLVEEQVERTPDAPALVYKDERLSYSELNRRANQIARYLRRAGVGPESRVGLCVERSIEMVVATLGVLKAGGAYVPLDPAYPRERLRFMLEDAAVKVLVTQSDVQDRLMLEVGEVISLDQDWDEISHEADDDPSVAVAAENLAYVIYTSGSTGRPKGVAITHRSAVAFIQWAKDVFPPSDLAGVLASTSLSFDLSVFELFVTLSAGGRIILADNALHLPTLEAAGEVTLINTVPSAMAELLRLGAVPAAVQIINLAGEALPVALVQEIYEKTKVRQVWNLYGPSEDTTYSTFAMIEKNHTGPMVIGRPVANTQAYICDELLQPMPVGVVGQLLLAGDGLARGYMGSPELTAERFLPNPFSSADGARLYLTGDLARYRADGQIEFLGRADSQVKLRGFRIEPGEIETLLREHPSVRDAMVIATNTDGGRLVAYVVRGQSGVQVKDLRDYLRERLPEYMVPSAFVLMDAFPLTPNGKIDRRALPPHEQSTTSDSELTTPRDVLELQLIQIWKEVLRREQIGLRDNFFDLGGHSLMAVRLIDKIERLVQQKIPLSILFQGATVEQLAASLRQRGEKVSEQSLVTIQPEGSRPPLFLVHSASGNVMSYVALARRLGREQPVYGLQSKGLDADRKPTANVEDMASEYLEELFAVQPDGPYFLGGWSMGGVIAFEMARQLTAQGKSVAPLVLIDSTIQTGRVKKNGWDDVSLLLALAQHHGLFLDDGDHTSADLRSLNLDEQLEFLLEKGAGYNQFPLDIGVPQLRHLFELFKVNVHASERYRPAKSEQQIILLQAADAPPGHAATVLRHWEKVAEVVEAQRLPGNHYSMLTEPNVTLLAEQINLYLPA